MEGLFAPAVTNTTRLTNRNPPVMCASAPTTGGISILLILVPTEAIQQRCHGKRLADSWRQAKRCLKSARGKRLNEADRSIEGCRALISAKPLDERFMKRKADVRHKRT